jgi:threonine aldolase
MKYEVGGSAVLAGVMSWTLGSVRGAMDPDEIERRAVKADLHSPGTTLVCVENTHNRAGGAVIPLDKMAAYHEVANRKGMKVHLDGARVFNASTALGVPVTEITKYADSVNFCLSKGLGSPVGSLLCGDAGFIGRARIWRKRLGGGTRQAGLLAACGIVSLTKGIARLAEDHARTQRLARALAPLPGLCVNPDEVDTNILMVDTLSPSQAWIERLRKESVWCLHTGVNRMRLVFHADIDDAKTARAIEAFRRIAAAGVRD